MKSIIRKLLWKINCYLIDQKRLKWKNPVVVEGSYIDHLKKTRLKYYHLVEDQRRLEYLFRILDEARASVMIGEGLHTGELYRLIASDLTIDKTWRQAVDIMKRDGSLKNTGTD